MNHSLALHRPALLRLGAHSLLLQLGIGIACLATPPSANSQALQSTRHVHGADSTVIRPNQTVTRSFTGPDTSETAIPNPFTDFRLLVTFTHPETSKVIRGYFAADGNAANSCAMQGNVWKVRFAPDRPGTWKYTAVLQTAPQIALNDDADFGEAILLADDSGVFEVQDSAERGDNERDLRNLGRLRRDGHYFRFGVDGPSWIKAGANSPENLLAYVDIDDTYRLEASERQGEAHTENAIHRYGPHLHDWRDGDPYWRDGKGKSLVGAINYLSSTGMNAVYFLTMNIGGDGQDVWPYADPQDFTRFDCSKLDQWEIVFEHMQRQGLMLHIVTQETENETLLDNGDVGPQRELYYRELIARFAHHPAIIWNLGEENGPADFSPNGQSIRQQKAMADFFKSHDPYHNIVLIHTHSTQEHQEPILSGLLGHSALDGISLQVADPKNVYALIADWRRRSELAGHAWAINMDEIGPANTGAQPDEVDASHDTMRRDVLWGSLLGGAAGVEWYFGYNYAHNDLNCEDWRSRDRLWKQTQLAIEFFQSHLSYPEMHAASGLVSSNAYCFANPGQTYVIYRPASTDADSPPIQLDLSGHPGRYQIQWFNPRRAEALQSNRSLTHLEGGQVVGIGQPPAEPDQDWVALIQLGSE